MDWRWTSPPGASRMGPPMKVVVNGENRDVPEGCTVSALVVELGLDGRPIAVEVNRRVVPRGEHPVTRLVKDDRVEVVHFVGGG